MASLIPSILVQALVLSARETWPRFNERQDEIITNLKSLEPPANILKDLRIAYAMSVWDLLKTDWRRSIKP